MSGGRVSRALERLDFGDYASDTLANVCWTPKTPAATPAHPHVHSFYELVLVERGTGSHLINGSMVSASPGHLALMAPGSTHDPRRLPGSAKFWVLIFNAHALNADGWSGSIYMGHGRSLGVAQLLLNRVYAAPAQHLLFHVRGVERSELVTRLQAIARENRHRQLGTEQVIASHLNIMLVALLRKDCGPGKAQPLSVHPLVGKALSYIDANFKKPISLFDIAKHVGRSPAHLTTLVHRLTGSSVMDWLRDRRLWEARTLLLSGQLSIEQIAASVGYDSARHFASLFKRRYGDSPLRWRNGMVA